MNHTYSGFLEFNEGDLIELVVNDTKGKISKGQYEISEKPRFQLLLPPEGTLLFKYYKCRKISK